MRRILIAFAAIALLAAPHITCASDVDDLKAAYEQYLQAFDARDLDKFMSLHNERWVDFAWNNPFPNVENSESYRQQIQEAWANFETFTITLIDPQYSVMGDTGIAYGHRRWVIKPKDGKQETYFLRYTDTWKKSDGKWLIVSKHRSVMPAGNEN